MKACVIQPPYSTDHGLSDKYFRWEMDAMDHCDESMDLIVFPEFSDLPCLTPTYETFIDSYNRFNRVLLEKAAETARRCQAILCVNALYDAGNGLRNTTHVFNKEGIVVGRYYKQHLTEGEVTKRKLDSDYSFEFEQPTVITVDGVRYGFLTCYDFYFYEMFANMARQNVDIIIGCSHQRSDRLDVLELMSKFCAYNCNAYVVRASVSMGENSDIGGGSIIVGPDGRVLASMENRVGMTTAEFDPHKKYLKPMGFGNKDGMHHEYIEIGRRPWKYRPGGSAIVRHDEIMPYPRTCAHRGFNTVAPENSLPAFGAAVAMGAEEIEFDLWFTADGEVVSIHDSTLDRVSNGTGKVWEYTLAELRELDFGSKCSEEFKGMKIPTFEEILQKFACHCIMNIHLKTGGDKPEYLEKVVRLIKKYDCEKYVYFMTGDDELMERLQKEFPEITRCCGGGKYRWEIVERAIKYDCRKVQFVKGYFNQEMVDRARANGIITNVFWSDDPAETEMFLDMGIDVILTNDYNRIAQVVGKRKGAR